MLVKLTNTGSGERVVYGRDGRPRSVLPGQSTEANLTTKLIERFEKNHENGDTLAVDRLGHDIEAARIEEIEDEKAARKLDEEKAKRTGEPWPRPPQGFTWGDNVMQEPKSLGEIERPGQLPGVEPVVPAPLPEMADRITQQSMQRAKQPEFSVEIVKPPTQPDPVSIPELLGRIDDMPESDVRRLATQMLPPNTLQGRPRKAAIIEALEKHANNRS